MTRNIGSVVTGAILAAALGASAIAQGSLAQGSMAESPLAGASANAVSFEPSDPTYFGNFALALEKTVARMPALHPETGLHVDEISAGLFAVTDGV